MREVVLLTGATGVVGQALLPVLEARPEIESIFALTRRDLPLRPPKVEVIRGDLADRLSVEQFPRTFKSITTIIHAAADVRFGAPREDLWRLNVRGLLNILELAVQCPRLSRFVFLSTVHVAGRRSGRILEHELQHAAGFINPYEESKYEAEVELRVRMATLPIMVLRLSTIIGKSDGSVARLAAIHQALRFYYHSLAPLIPGTAESSVDLVALDFAARAITELSFASFQAGQTFHVCGGDDSLTLAELIDLTRDCFLRFRPAWRKRAVEKPSIVDLRTFEMFVRSVEEVGDEGLRTSVSVLKHFAPQLAFPKQYDDRECTRILTRTPIARPKIRDYFPRIVQHLIANGWTGYAQPSLELACR
jgi:nucleoside-diphosphate-sugar epimerase